VESLTLVIGTRHRAAGYPNYERGSIEERSIHVLDLRLVNKIWIECQAFFDLAETEKQRGLTGLIEDVVSS
jgi:hypothetical protein